MFVTIQCLLHSQSNADMVIQRAQYLNAQNTFAELLNMGVVPIVNENDTLAVAVGHVDLPVLGLNMLTTLGNYAPSQIW